MAAVKNNAPVPYFSISRNEEEKSADIYIFGDITQRKGGIAGIFQPSSDQSSYDLANQVKGIPEDWEITVHVNSNGGELKEGLGIYNTLKTRNVTTICEGFAASAGSVIFCAGAKRLMQPASLLFIHQAQMSANGNADDHQKAAEDLRIVTEAAVNAYKECGVKVDDEALMRMLRAETWITPEEAVTYGFATGICEQETDEVITNDAMRAVMAAVGKTARDPTTDERHERVFDIAEKIIDAMGDNLDAVIPKIKAYADKAAGRKKEEKKGFWGFKR